MTFREDTATSRTGSGPANLATIRAAIIAAIKRPATCTSPKADAVLKGTPCFAARSLGEVARQISSCEYQDPPSPHPGPADPG